MRGLFLLGRAIFGGFFIYNALNHLMNTETMSQYAASKGVPSPELAVRASGAVLLGGGMSVLTGVKPRRGLAAIIGFLIPVSLQMHRFWDVQDPGQRMAETVNFAKNMALVGAALTMMEIEEPWPISVDDVRALSEDMYVRIGSRELTALPA